MHASTQLENAALLRRSRLALQLLAIVALVATSSFAHTQTTPYLLWPSPNAIPFPTPLSAVQLNAIALAGAPVPVSLNGFYNVTGMTTKGANAAGYPAGFDESGYSYDANLVGSSIVWQGVVFPLGPPNAPNAVTSATVPVPLGSYSALLLLGSQVQNPYPPTATFTVNYTDGTTATLTQALSDWVNTADYPGQSDAICTQHRLKSDGTVENNSVCIFGYRLPLDSAKTVKSITLPNDRDAVIVAMALLPPVVSGSFSYAPVAGTVPFAGTLPVYATFTPANPSAYNTANASVSLAVTPTKPLPVNITWPKPASIPYGTALSATQLDATASALDGPVLVPLAPYFTDDAIYDDSALFSGLNFSNGSFSSAQLGGAVSYAGASFPLGAPNVPNAVANATVALPAGNFTALDLIAAATGPGQTGLPFTVTYTDGTTITKNLNVSPWNAPQSYPGETVAASTAYELTGTGQKVPGTFDLYGYQIALDPTRTVSTLTLPPIKNVAVFAAGLVMGASFNVPGNFVYTPSAGSVPPFGTDPLSAAFTPTDTAQFKSVTATNSIVVTSPQLNVLVESATRFYGAPNPAFVATVTGVVNGDIFTETFLTTATPASPVGVYPVIPIAAGANLSSYTLNLQPGILTVTQAPVAVSVASNKNLILQATSVQLTATVASTTTGTPTGTVAFFANGTPLGTAALVNGTATLATTALPLGTDAITVTYSGDTDFLAGTSSGSALAITVSGLDFTLQTPNGTALNTVIGNSAQLTLHVAPMFGIYSYPVVFSLTGTLPTGARASFSPSAVASNAGPTDVTLQIETQKFVAAMPPTRPANPFYWATVLLIPLAGLSRLRAARRGVRNTRLLLVLVGLGAMVAMQGCGTESYRAQYQFTVTATSGTFQHSVPVTLQFVTGQ